MTFKLGVLSLSLLLIALLSAQLMQAKPQYHSHGDHSASGEGWAHAQPQRPHVHHHHHGHGHPHGHGHHHNQFTDRYSPNYSAGQQLAPDQGHALGAGGNTGQTFSGFGQTAPGYAGIGNGVQPSVGYGRQQSGAGYAGQGADWGYGSRRQQSGAGYGSQAADWGSAGQSSAGFGNRPRPSYGGSPQLYQPRPGQPHSCNESVAEGVQGNQPIQPRPQMGGQDTLQFSQQPNGQGGNPLQPRPEVSTGDAQQSVSPIQPRPQQGGQGQFGVEQQQAGNAGSHLQPRPDGGINTPSELPESDNEPSGSPIQPRPPKLNLQTTDDKVNHSVIQPIPGQGEHGTNAGLVEFGDLSTGSIFQSDPENSPHSAVDDNIASIFNTQNFLSPTLNEDSHSHEPKDPKSQPESVGERNLFDTIPKCPEGSELRGGHCRRKA